MISSRFTSGPPRATVPRMAKLYTINQSLEHMRAAYDETGPGLVIRFCPICSLGCGEGEDFYAHVRDEHPGVVIKEVHPTGEGHA